MPCDKPVGCGRGRDARGICGRCKRAATALALEPAVGGCAPLGLTRHALGGRSARCPAPPDTGSRPAVIGGPSLPMNCLCRRFCGHFLPAAKYADAMCGVWCGVCAKLSRIPPAATATSTHTYEIVYLYILCIYFFVLCIILFTKKFDSCTRTEVPRPEAEARSQNDQKEQKF